MIIRATSIVMALAVVLLVIPFVEAATVEYPEEYYRIAEESTAEKNPIGDFEVYDGFIANWEYANWLEIRRQTILMERQNELIAERNHIMWIQTCWMQKTSAYDYLNTSAWEQECQKAGYPV